MTPEGFAARHPMLWRLAAEGAADGVRRHGLLAARELAARAGVALPDVPRRTALRFALPDGTPVQVTDNAPLSFAKLAPALDDGLRPEAWLAMLNDRAFLWPDRRLAARNLRARKRLGYRSEWHGFDTLALLAPVWDRAEIAPINSGATVRAPARRGLSTFAPLATLDWERWRRARGRKAPDKVKEVTIRGGAPEAGAALRVVEPA
ncbi:DUF7002 family protein [Jannaschia sp. W003]|uniref:DUF7002 family protein n=1 Tax=Jannaschia sp. W003 TaxID=2867012 RepID=UPI0021A30B64|nr:hypothetical protein [Jannaschia sp. W003]UWQ21962.1 hypothetical protein K3554_02720 [Jannaschia sp. W003]